MTQKTETEVLDKIGQQSVAEKTTPYNSPSLVPFLFDFWI
jgi:hypothetical protein